MQFMVMTGPGDFLLTFRRDPDRRLSSSDTGFPTRLVVVSHTVYRFDGVCTETSVEVLVYRGQR